MKLKSLLSILVMVIAGPACIYAAEAEPIVIDTGTTIEPGNPDDPNDPHNGRDNSGDDGLDGQHHTPGGELLTGNKPHNTTTTGSGNITKLPIIPNPSLNDNNTNINVSALQQPLSQATINEIFEIVGQNKAPAESSTGTPHNFIVSNSEDLGEIRGQFIKDAQDLTPLELADKYLKSDVQAELAAKYLNGDGQSDDQQALLDSAKIEELLKGVTEVLSSIHGVDYNNKLSVNALKNIVRRIYQEDPTLMGTGLSALSNEMESITNKLFGSDTRIGSEVTVKMGPNLVTTTIKIADLFTDNDFTDPSGEKINALADFLASVVESQSDCDAKLVAIEAQLKLVSDEFNSIGKQLSALDRKTFETIKADLAKAIDQMEEQKKLAISYALDLGVKLEVLQNGILNQDYIASFMEASEKLQNGTITEAQFLEVTNKDWKFLKAWMSDALPQEEEQEETMLGRITKEIINFLKNLAAQASTAQGCFSKVKSFIVEKGKFVMLDRTFGQSSTGSLSNVSATIFENLAERLLQQQEVALKDPDNNKCVLMNDERNAFIIEIQGFIEKVKESRNSQDSSTFKNAAETAFITRFLNTLFNPPSSAVTITTSAASSKK